MTSKRTYNQYCSLARTLDIIGERWTLLIIRDLLGGPKRYKDLLQSLSGIGTNLLANRLKELETAHLIEQTQLPPPVSVQAYRLTPRGAQLEPAIVALANWGLPLLKEPRQNAQWQAQWNHVALKARYHPKAAHNLQETYAFNIDGYPHYAVIDNDAITTHEGTPPNPAFTLTTDRDTFLNIFEGHTTLEAAIASGTLTLTGNLDAFQRCTTIFSK